MLEHLPWRVYPKYSVRKNQVKCPMKRCSKCSSTGSCIQCGRKRKCRVQCFEDSEGMTHFAARISKTARHPVEESLHVNTYIGNNTYVKECNSNCACHRWSNYIPSDLLEALLSELVLSRRSHVCTRKCATMSWTDIVGSMT